MEDVLHLLADSGLRVSECMGLNWSRIDFEASLIRVTHQLGRDPDKLLVPLKTDKSKRNVPMTARRHLLLNHTMASSFKADSDLVFATSSGKSPGYNNSRRALQSALDKIALHPGDSRLGIHALRHYYGTALLLDGVHFQTVSRLLGHSIPAVTLSTYAHVFEICKRATSPHRSRRHSAGRRWDHEHQGVRVERGWEGSP